MIRGEIWWAELPRPRGSEPAKRRPVLVIQGDTYNRSALSTVICAVITSNRDLAQAPPNFLLEKGISGLDKPSVINFSQIITIDKAFFIQQVSMLPKTIIERINAGLKQVLDIW
ncbi:type II toxin-antitoxin system PemK/MazF family toxin [Treponema sp. TIM-1]|uniref:type II toxin-antitoxin system PemK/MazF family toxin n=1 Tax=Treponema sp. TIM-1 TaxID=2898417 RepID=UPI00397FF1A2